jgi:hypothetical protein
VAGAGVHLDGRCAGADADLHDPLRRPWPCATAVFLFCVAAFQSGDLRVDAVQPEGVPHAQGAESVQVGWQVVEHVFDSMLMITSRPLACSILCSITWRGR